jgi:MATE family multidrug resistance protein
MAPLASWKETIMADTASATQGAPRRTVRGELKELLLLGWPLVLAQLAQNALFTTDVIMIGWLGSKYLAAATLANALFVGIQLFGVGVTSAVAPLVAQARGSGNLRAIRKTVQMGLWLSVVLVVLLLPLAWNIKPIYLAIGQDPELSALAESFVHTAVWLFVPAFMIVVLRSFLSALGATRVILVITLAGIPLNVLFNYALIFGNFGFPRLELAGAGIATTLVNVVMLLMMVAYIVLHKRHRRFHIFARLSAPDLPAFLQLLKIGLPIGLMLLAEVSLFTCASLLQGWIGEAEVAAHAVALQLSATAFMVPLGLSQATTVRVGLALGQGDRHGVGIAGWTAFGVTLAFMSSTALLMVLFPHQLVGLFLDGTVAENMRPLSMAATFLSVAALYQLADGGQVAMAAALRGISDTRMPLVIALIGYWGVGFPTSYIAGFVFGLGGMGIWYGLAAGLGAVAVALTVRFAMRERLHLGRLAA